MELRKIFRWQDVSNAPAEPGIYAWYYTPEILQFDLERIIKDVDFHKSQLAPLKAKDCLRLFLNEAVFQYFKEQPFTTRLEGKLKPRYEGLVEHRPTLSESLLDRLVEDPRRLHTIKHILETSVPEFASPIYIGMSERLRSRLLRHKILIEKYGETFVDHGTDEEQRDQSFAKEIRVRNIPPSRLSVAIRVVEGPPGSYVDIENILNRVHYPLLGRN